MAPPVDSYPSDVYLADLAPRPGFFQRWEHRRHHRTAHWFFECLAEAGGAFCYCWLGMGAQAAFTIGNILGMPLGSLFTIGFSYGLGIIISLSIFSATSGGHFSPAITICFCAFKGFPWSKAPRYIVSQILGAYFASILVYAQWRTFILDAEALLASKPGLLEATLFTSQGPAGIFALYAPAGSNLGLVWLNEFVVDVMLGLLIWSVLDPTNTFAPPPVVPWIIAFAYSSIIWGFSVPGLAANTARDLGGRLAAITFWGTDAAGGSYAAIAALTNIPAIFLAAIMYEFCFADSSRIVPHAQRDFLRAHVLHLQRRQTLSEGQYGHATGIETGSVGSREKGTSEGADRA